MNRLKFASAAEVPELERLGYALRGPCPWSSRFYLMELTDRDPHLCADVEDQYLANAVSAMECGGP